MNRLLDTTNRVLAEREQVKIEMHRAELRNFKTFQTPKRSDLMGVRATSSIKSRSGDKRLAN